jgi:hypothetical protein
VNQKYFSLDKNYILKQAQADYQIEFLSMMVDIVKEAYSEICNPMGLEDKFVIKLRNLTHYKLEHLEFFYLKLSGIYRFKYGNDNQLEFIFNGPGHYEKFRNQWEEKFFQWIRDFSKDPSFIKAVLEIAVLYPGDREVHLAENKLNHFLNDRFKLKIRKKRGQLAFRIA